MVPNPVCKLVKVMSKILISVERYAKSTDLRQTGSNLSTGCKAVYLINGKKKTNKIYMTNSVCNLYFYIKNKGKNVQLQTEDVIYHMHTYNLTANLWFIEK